jgi:hypothetical protein
MNLHMMILNTKLIVVFCAFCAFCVLGPRGILIAVCNAQLFLVKLPPYAGILPSPVD